MIISTKHNQEEDTIKFLGIYVNTNLKWGDHVDYLQRKLSTAIFMIRRIRKISTYAAARTAYFSYFQSVATYGILIWGNSRYLERILIQQKEALRAMVRAGYRESCKPIFKQHGILTMPAMFIVAAITYIHNNISQYTSHAELHHHDTRFRADLVVPRHRIDRSRSTINYTALKLYNKLPGSLRSLTTKQLERKVKSLLLQNTIYKLDDFVCN